MWPPDKYDRLLHEDPLADGADATDIRADPIFRRLVGQAAAGGTLALSAPAVEQLLSRELAARLNVNTSAYDRAIDAVYNETHVGGSLLHHNLDGCHTWDGAVKALQAAFPDDSGFQHACGALVHLAKDVTTPSGINPLLDPNAFLETKQLLVQDLHIPPSAVNDLLNINAIELCAAGVATVSLLMGLRDHQTHDLGRYAARLGLASCIAGNPILLLMSAICLGRVCHAMWSGDSHGGVFAGAVEGSASAAAFFSVVAAVPDSVFLGLTLAAVACYGIGRIIGRAFDVDTRSLDEVLEAQFAGYRSYYRSLA